MPIQLTIPKLAPDNQMFFTWAPVQITARQVDVPAGGQTRSVTVRNGGQAGRFWFSDQRIDQGDDEIVLDIPADGSPVTFWIAGEFQSASRSYGDASLIFFESNALLGELPAMIRVRKNANLLTDDERDRFLNAFALLNGQGAGRFSEFRAMHTSQATAQAHGDSAFPPWHRAYLLDLERELQAIDAEVTLPYWRFDEPAPNVFNPDFMGAPGVNGALSLSPGNPLISWVSDGQPGIDRTMNFLPDEAPPPLGLTAMLNEVETLQLGGAQNEFGPFRSQFESNPHGFAHVSFSGDISSVPSAARDPLFFMLHANVDRLWAKWQWIHRRHDPFTSASFAASAANREGHRLNDTMWPWNGVTGGSRPPDAPGGALQFSPTTDLPGASPRVDQMLDYLNTTGREDVRTGGDLGFCYDDVPFQVELPGAIT